MRHVFSESVFIALVSRLIENPPLQTSRKILLCNPVVPKGMGVKVALSMAKIGTIPVSILEGIRDIPLAGGQTGGC